MAEMKLQGGCFCRAIRYQVEGKAVCSGICHCRTCRKTASAPALPFVAFPADAVRFTQGHPVAFRSSPSVTRSFCGQFGSPLTYRNDEQPGSIDVMTCSLDDPEAVPPTFHVWSAEKLGWDAATDALPAFRTTRAAG